MVGSSAAAAPSPFSLPSPLLCVHRVPTVASLIPWDAICLILVRRGREAVGRAEGGRAARGDGGEGALSTARGGREEAHNGVKR